MRDGRPVTDAETEGSVGLRVNCHPRLGVGVPGELLVLGAVRVGAVSMVGTSYSKRVPAALVLLVAPTVALGI